MRCARTGAMAASVCSRWIRSGIRGKAQLLLPSSKILLQRHCRSLIGNVSQRLADDQLVMDELKRSAVAEQQNGLDALHEFGKPGQRMMTHGGQRLRQPDGID